MRSGMFREFQARQRALAVACVSASDFEKSLRLLTLDFRQKCMELDSMDRDHLCEEWGLQLQRELIHAESARHRQVLLALLKKIERIKHQSPGRAGS